MTNKEKYADKIIEIAARSKLALKDGKPVPCAEMRCSECGFLSTDYTCNHKVHEWLNSEYVEKPVDWSKVAVDTPILVRDFVGGEWARRYFAKYENGIVYAWENGATSWSAHRSNITDWGMAKLAESEKKNIECMRNAACEHMTLDEQISFCEEKSKNIKLKADPQTFIDIKNSLEKLKELRGGENE